MGVIQSLPDRETLRREAFEIFKATLEWAGEVSHLQWVNGQTGGDSWYDLSCQVTIARGALAAQGQVWQFRGLIKSTIYPREARLLVSSLKQNPTIDDKNNPIYTVLIAPYISDAVAQICEDGTIGWLDLSGNRNLEFGGIWIEQRRKERKYKEKRTQKSLFSTKATRVLRVLLQGPLRYHKVEALAVAAGVSLGLVSKIRTFLLDQELAEEGKDGICIEKPQEILRDWMQADDFEKRVESRDYSLLDYDAVKVAALLGERLDSLSISHAFTQWFAGWLRAPYTLPPMISVYVEDFPDDAFLREHLGARRVSRHEGRLRLLKSSDYQGVTIGQQKVKGFNLVSDVQIFLDLARAGLRGDEQADELRHRKDFAGGWE